MLLNCGVGEDSWESLGLQGDPASSSQRKSVLTIHWKDWCWSWNSSTLATWCKELTPWKRPWCWERLKVGGEGDDRRWDGWMVSPTQWTWVWVSFGSWWWTGKPGVLQSMGLQRVVSDSYHPIWCWTYVKSQTVLAIADIIVKFFKNLWSRRARVYQRSRIQIVNYSQSLIWKIIRNVS